VLLAGIGVALQWLFDSWLLGHSGLLAAALSRYFGRALQSTCLFVMESLSWIARHDHQDCVCGVCLVVPFLQKRPKTGKIHYDTILKARNI